MRWKNKSPTREVPNLNAKRQEKLVPEQPDEPGVPKPPSLLWAAIEIQRALSELSTLPAAWPLLKRAPRGDGHPVLVLPGYTASDISTGPLRRYLRALGYDVYAWELGRNWGITGDIEERMYARAASIFEETGRKMSIVG